MKVSQVKNRLKSIMVVLMAVFLFAGSAVPVMAAGDNLSAQEQNSYLFVGNSMTFFNNTPEMFQRMVKAGTGNDISVTACLYGYKTLKDHATSIKAVIRTKGDVTQLSNEEKRAMWGDITNRDIFYEAIYNGYKTRLLDQNGEPKKFSTVFLQMFYEDGAGDTNQYEVAEAIEKIVNAMDSPQTTYVVNATYGRFKGGLKKSMEAQDVLDRAGSEGVQIANSKVKGKCKQILFCSTGRAFCNYLATYGYTRAQILEPEAYDICSDLKIDGTKEGSGAIHDLGYGDNLHPTMLGSYLTVSVLYSTVCGNPSSTTSSYHGGVKNAARILTEHTRTGYQCHASTYRSGAGFKHESVLQGAAKIAWETVSQKKVLSYKSDAKGLAETKAKSPVMREAVLKNDGIFVTWKAMKGSARYKVYRKKKGGNWKAIDTVYGTGYLDKKAAAGATYQYTVRCMDQTADKFLSKFNKKGIRFDHYNLPTLTSVKRTAAGPKVKWQKVKGVKYYAIIRRTVTGGWKTIKITSKKTFTDKSAKAGTKYAYAVRGMDSTKKRYVTCRSNDIIIKW